MEKSRIKYICYYDLPDAKVRRSHVLAATNKLDYIWQVLNRIGYGVDVISASCCGETKLRYCHGGVRRFGGDNTLRLFPSLGGPKIIRVLGRYYLWLRFFFWFLFNVKRGETVIVYHSLGYCRLLALLRRLTGCRIVGEIEEIYQDVSPQKPSVCKAEHAFAECCAGYIFPTNLLDMKLNPHGKPCVLVHGIYSVEPSRNVRWDDDDMHVVYAGTFDPNKGGAVAAATAAAYLPKGYHVHICGFGSENEEKSIVETIGRVNARTEATVTFDGLLRGEDFIVFLQKCHIGLSTQNPDAAFNATSFPSKILTYLSNGLQVVSIRIPAIEQSAVADCVFFYDRQEPKEIAKAIVAASVKQTDSKQQLREADKKFGEELKNLMQLSNKL